MVAFQGFEDPDDDARWDHIAVRMSEDGGDNWSPVSFITRSGFPEGSGRPFDPTITWDADSEGWRMYFSLGFNGKMLDDSVCTYSAYSMDGVDFVFEDGSRFCNDSHAVIDPAVIQIDGTWVYIAPRGAPQDGAFFATSPDGLNFDEGDAVSSDMNHNWTGNFALVDGGLRFYGGESVKPQGNFIWWASSDDKGSTWSDYTQTNIPASPYGKDPGIIQRPDGTWLMVVPTLP
jgi:hypothetical protein